MKQFIIFLILLIPSISIAGKTYTCTVLVSDLMSHEHLEGILVTFYSEDEYFEATTNSNGSVIFSGLHSKEGELIFVDPKNVYELRSIVVYNDKRVDQSYNLVLHQPMLREPLSFYEDRNKRYTVANLQDSTNITDTINCDSLQNSDTEFPNGEEAMKQFIRAYTRYPSDAAELGEQGVVYVSFFIEKDGTITHAEVKKSLFPSLDLEAISLIYSMPAWTPGMHCGEPVRSKVRLPITFSLH